MKNCKSLAVACTFLLTATFFLSGCAGLGKKVEPPRVSLANIRVQEVKLLETVFQMELRVFNTGEGALNINGLDTELVINDRTFARGVNRTNVTIPAYGTELVTLDVYSSAMNMVSALLDMMEGDTPGQMRDTVAYELKGNLHLGGVGRPDKVPFNVEGKLSPGNLPGASRSLVPSP
ncbi:MAG: LEA type 2 family protein [bacterium]